MENWLGKLFRHLLPFEQCAYDHPLQTGMYFVSTALCLLLLLHYLRRSQAPMMFWCVVGLILIDACFCYGHDTTHHIYRIVALAEQIRDGKLSLFLTNPTTGEAFPIFVYYSFVPYLLPAALDLAGLSPDLSFRMAMLVPVVVLAWGTQALIDTIYPSRSERENRLAYLAAILFVTANYVYGLSHTRAALGELYVAALMPWVVKFVLSRGSMRLLTAVIFVQICVHPLVLPQSLVGEAVVAIGLSRESPVR